MEIKINVDEETFQEIKLQKLHEIEIWKTKFKTNLSCYDVIQIVKWQTNDVLIFPIRNIITEPKNTKYKVLFGEENNHILKRHICLFLFFFGFILSFLITVNYQEEIDDLKEEIISLQIKNNNLEAHIKKCSVK